MAFGNAKSILTRLGVALDSAPNDLDTREARLDQVNRHYLDLSEEVDWLRLQVEVDWPVFADLTGETAASTATFTAGTYAVTFSVALGAAFIAAAAGQVIEDAAGTLYTITRFETSTLAYIATPYAAATNATSAWTIRMRHAYLPVDCARALGFIDRVNGVGRMVVIDRRREELAFSTAESTGTSYWVADDDNNYDRAPDPGLTLTDATGAGTLPANSIWEVCYTFSLQGRESPPSPPVRITLGAGATHSIALAGMESTQVGALDTGIYKRIYGRQISSGLDAQGQPVLVFGRWLFHSQITVEATTTATILAASEFDRSDTTALYFQNGRKWMRPLYTPGADAMLRLRYLRRPRPLVSDADVPWMPEAYHDLLVYGPAIDLAVQHSVGQKIPTFQTLYRGKLERMKATGLLVPDVSIQKASMRIGNGRAPYRAGTVNGDFSG